MNKDNISAVVMAIAVISVIVGFAIYFNTHGSKISNNPSSEFTNITEQIDKSQFKKASNFSNIAEYINTNPISLDDLKGKIVLVDFWTYSCINCIRTIPYLNDWHEKYSDDGLVIVGVHTPEFEFEKDTDNVQSAIQKFEIKYPVLQDNDKKTWDAYENKYWPRKYLIDNEGYIRYDHIGEGAYKETEKVIQTLLKERSTNLGIKKPSFNDVENINNVSKFETQDVDFSKIKTPELYFGYEFARAPLGNIEGLKPNQNVFYSITLDNKFKSNLIYLEGEWMNNPDHMELQSDNGSIVLKYNAKSVNIVAGGKGNFTVTQDGSPIKNDARKTSANNETFEIDKQRLYNLVTNKQYGEHTIKIDVQGDGFQIYTFTFG